MLTNNPADGYNTSQHRREKREMIHFFIYLFHLVLSRYITCIFGFFSLFNVWAVISVSCCCCCWRPSILLSLIFFPIFWFVHSLHNITAIIITHSAADPFEIEVVQHIARAHPVCIICAYYNNSRGIMNDNHPVIMQSNLISIIWIHTQRKNKNFPFRLERPAGTFSLTIWSHRRRLFFSPRAALGAGMPPSTCPINGWRLLS